METAVLELSNLTVRRGKKRLLAEISWRVQPGEHWAILGANGSGKTSLLKTLTGYLTPTSGELFLLGRKFGEADWRELRTAVGLVSSAISQLIPNDETALSTVLSGKAAMVGHWGAVREDDRRFALCLLRQVKAAALADRPWCLLSQGERQRTLIARALMSRPRLLILDEPCAGLDPVARQAFLRFIDAFARKKAAPSVILVTHHVEEITPAFTHGLLLRRGRIVAAGPIKDVLTDEILSRTFDATVRLQRSGSRARLIVVERGNAV